MTNNEMGNMPVSKMGNNKTAAVNICSGCFVLSYIAMS